MDCTVIQAVVHVVNGKSKGRRQISSPHILVHVTTQMILTKLETENYHQQITYQAILYFDPVMWVVWVNTQFAIKLD